MKITEAHKNAAKTAYMLVMGAFLLTLLSFVVWATVNFDVLVKAIRFPEAVRQLQVEVSIVQK